MNPRFDFPPPHHIVTAYSNHGMSVLAYWDGMDWYVGETDHNLTPAWRKVSLGFLRSWHAIPAGLLMRCKGRFPTDPVTNVCGILVKP